GGHARIPSETHGGVRSAKGAGARPGSAPLIAGENCVRGADHGRQRIPPWGARAPPGTPGSESGVHLKATHGVVPSRPWNTVTRVCTVAPSGSATRTVRSPALRRARRAR